MIRLTAVIELEGQAPRALTHESSAGTVVIGRDSSADFQVPLPTVSRQHARVSESDGVYLIEDLGSTHGTVVNGKQIGENDKKVLRDGDVIDLPGVKITCTVASSKGVSAEPGEGTQAIAARAVQGILGRLGDAHGEGPYLRVLGGPEEGVRFFLSGTLTEWALGRSKECEFILNDPNVSRKHAIVKKDWSGYTVHDLGSKNGVLVNDRQVSKPRRLKDQDELIIGPIRLVYVDPDAGLLDALKDVPGFDIEEGEDVEPPEADPSHAGPLASEAAEQNSGDPVAGVPQEGPVDDEPQGEGADPYADIDPDLLTEVPPAGVLQWLAIGGGVLVVLAAIGVLYLILS